MSRALFIATVVIAFTAASAAASSLPTGAGLARGPYARMHMVLEKTFLQIDVVRIDVRYGKATRDRIAAIAKGHDEADAVADRIARAAMAADDALVEIEFLRDASFDRWLKSARRNLKRTRDAGLIDEATYRRVHRQLPNWFRAVRERGFEEGDRLLYRARPASLRTVLVSGGGKVLLDRTEQGQQPSRTLLAGYFAPETPFREPLIESLFEE